MNARPTMRSTTAVVVAVLVMGLLAGCARPGGSAGETSSSMRAGIAPGAAAPADTAQRTAAQPLGAPAPDMATNGGGSAAGAVAVPSAKGTADRLVIRDGNLRLQVKDVPRSTDALRALATRYGGSVIAMQLATDGGTPVPEPMLSDASGSKTLSSGLPFRASVTMQVPVAKFDALRADVEKLGEVVSASTGDQDVTQQHVDLKARLDNARAEEARLRTFFLKAKTVEEMLSIERELARVRGDIESMDAQLKQMERQAAQATLTVELVEPAQIVQPTNGIDWGFREALSGGIQSGVELVKWMVTLVLALAPLWILGIALFFFIRWRVRVRRARRVGEPEPVQETPAG